MYKLQAFSTRRSESEFSMGSQIRTDKLAEQLYYPCVRVLYASNLQSVLVRELVGRHYEGR